MKIAIGADHRGYESKTALLKSLQAKGHTLIDQGTHSSESCDYPPIAAAVSKAVAAGEADRGILVCKSGIGMSIAANKVKGIRAALCYSLHAAKLSRQHNDANVLVLGADEIRDPVAKMIDIWLETEFEGGRHKRRVDQIKALEEKGV